MGERAKEAAETDLSRYAGVLARRFIRRWDLYPLQLDDGRYLCIHEPLNAGHLFAHLKGEITLGTYLLDDKGKAGFIVLDADDQRGFGRLAYLEERLANETIPSYLEASVRVLEFIADYVELTENSSGATGLCPFHDDHHPSLGVNNEHNYWHCFAGCGGGSIIDFWMKWRGIDFETALGELSKKLLT